eukprot:1668157-Prymnesium_polylepis.1
MDQPLSGLYAMVEMAILGIKFSPNFDAPATDDFTTWEWLSFLLFTAINAMFAIVCIILLVRLLMAMMTNTFRSVQEKAQLEWRLLLLRHVLRIELVALKFGGARVQARQVAGVPGERGTPDEGKHFHHFLHVQAAPGEAINIPMQLAQAGNSDLFYDMEDEALPESSAVEKHLGNDQKSKDDLFDNDHKSSQTRSASRASIYSRSQPPCSRASCRASYSRNSSFDELIGPQLLRGRASSREEILGSQQTSALGNRERRASRWQ